MTTTVVKTIGTASRDYSTLQAWEDACPADLVAVDQIWQGQCYNDSEFTGGMTAAGTTTSATQYKELTTAAGQSFSDNASVQTNALRYNQANGVAISVAGGYSTAIVVSDINFRMSKVQVKVSSDAYAYDNNTASTAHVLDKCILQQAGSAGACIRLRGGTLSNSLLSKNSAGTSKAAITGAYGGATLTNCTIVRPTTYAVGGTAVAAGSSFSFTLKNVAVFGFTADTSGTISATTCYTDDSTPTTGFTTVAYNTSTGSGFQNTAVTTADFRIKTGSALLDVGTTDTTYAATDIAGTARPQGSAYDVGCWELVVASGTNVTPGTGSIAITGYAPSIAQTANQAVAPDVGNIVITGYAPTISQPRAVNPGVGSLTITGYAPTVTQNVDVPVNPGVGTIAITGYAPTVAQTANQLITPDVGNIAITGYSPTVSQSANQAVTPDVGTITITGYAPTVQQAPASQNITPDVGTITIAGYAPTVEQSSPLRLGGFEYGSKVYIKRNKKIYIFDSVEEADSYLEAEAKAEEIVQQSNKTSRLARKRAREKAFKSLAIEPVESVDIPALKTLVAQLQTDFELPKLIAQQDWQRVVEIYNQAMEMQDEEDLLLIL